MQKIVTFQPQPASEVIVAELVPWLRITRITQTAMKDARPKELRNAGRIEVVKIDGEAKFSVWNP